MAIDVITFEQEFGKVSDAELIV